jgi:hypothetical protein
MKDLGMNFAFGVSPCSKFGHTLRTRAGHCVQCNTANIAFQLRKEEKGSIYIAGSPSSRLIKIGVTNDVDARIRMLNHYGYGGYQDWEVLLRAFIETAGMVEIEAQRELDPYSVEGFYFREGRKVEALELFRCSYIQAKDAVLAYLPQGSRYAASREDRASAVYS